MPVQAALREWARLLAPGGRAGFSTMSEGFPVAARLFREHARAYGLTLTDPATPLGTTTRCAQALRDARITPADLVTETIRFSRRDLEHAWQAHAQGTHHDAVAALTPEQAHAFRRDYTSALTGLLGADPDHLLTSEVIYAFGRKSPSVKAQPLVVLRTGPGAGTGVSRRARSAARARPGPLPPRARRRSSWPALRRRPPGRCR